MSDKIGKLCELLDDTTIEKPYMTEKGKDKTFNTKNIKVLLFQLDERVSEIEKQMAEVQNLIPSEFMEEDKQIPLIDPGKISYDKLPFEKSPEGYGPRSILSKHEMFLNDLNMRLSDIELSINRMDPTHMRSIIKDIADLIIQEKTIEMSATVDGIKRVHTRDTQIMDSLKESLKELDEKFKVDIDRKVEVKDLKLTKNQLRRRVIALVFVDARIGIET